MSARDLLDTVSKAANERAKTVASAAIDTLEATGSLDGATSAETEVALQALIRQRWFTFARRLGALAVTTFGEHRGLRRRYGQALIETGDLIQARAQFEQLLRLKAAPRSERYEWQGFVGRTHKQEFVDLIRATGRVEPAALRATHVACAATAVTLSLPLYSAPRARPARMQGAGELV